MAEIKWSEAPQSVIHTAEELIRQYHPDLEEAQIAFVMRSEPQKRGPRYILGSACKVPQKMQPYLEYDFLIWLSESDYTNMSDAEREALIDHELCHCSQNGDGWTLLDHDIQEFAAIIARHGLWTTDLRRMDKAVEIYRQEKFPLRDAEITFSGGGKVTTMTGAELDKAVSAMGD